MAGFFGMGRQPGQPRYSGQLHNMSITESVFGTTLPIVFGTTRVHGKLLDYNGFAVSQSGGAKGIFGGGKGGVTEYSANVAIALAQGPCADLLSVWDQQGKLANQSTVSSYTVPTGGGTWSSTIPTTGYNQGVTRVVTYTVTANDYGSGGPVTYTGTQAIALTQVASSPGYNEYSYDKATQIYTFGPAMAGVTVQINISSQFSLFYFEVTQAAEVPLASPYTISTDNQPYFQSDNGVTFVDTGEPLTSTGSSSPGEGQYHENVGFYTFSAADAGRYVYIKYTYYTSDSTLTSSSALNLTLFTGEQGQAAWNFFVSNFPASAFGYTGICYVGANPMAMGESPTLPSYNYELVGLCCFPALLDADVTLAINALLTGPLFGVNYPGVLADWSNAQAYWAANNFFISDCLTSQEAVGDTIKKWLDAGNVGAVNSVEGLKLIPYGDTTNVGNGYTFTPPTTPVATLVQSDLLPFSDKKTGETTSEDPLQVERTAGRDAYNYMQAEWTNRENDYNSEITEEQNDAFIRAYGLRMEGSQSWRFLTTQAAASWALNLRMKRGLYKRNTYKFNLGWNFCYLEPMDIVLLPTGEPVRITEIEDDEAGKLAITAEQFSYGSGNASIYTKQPPNSYSPVQSQALPGSTSACIFEPTTQSVIYQPNTLEIAVAGNNPNWGGCDVYVSTDGTTYAKVPGGRIIGGHTLGLLSAPLAAGSDPDTTDTLSVDMTLSGGELVTATAAEANAFVTLSAIIDAAGTMELVSYETSTLTGPNRYNLTYLRRGVYGSTIASHAIGAEFAYLGTKGLFSYQYPSQYVGKTLYFKFPAFNLVQGQEQDLSQCQAFPFTVPGTSLGNPNGSFYTVPFPLSSFIFGSSPVISVAPFTAGVTGLAVSCLPAGAVTLDTADGSALTLNTTYTVYYYDPAFAGGAITPLATQNPANYQGKAGYYVIGTVTTPNPPTPTGPWYPTEYDDTGDYATQYPQAVTEPTTILPPPPALRGAQMWGVAQVVSGSGYQTAGNLIVYDAFESVTPTGMTLYITAQTTTVASGTVVSTVYDSLAEVSFDGGSTWNTVFDLSTSTEEDTYTYAVPDSTDLSLVQVRFTTTASYTATGSSTGSSATMKLRVHSVYIGT